MTLRDSVWNAVLEQLVKTGRFRISELPFSEAQRHTVRRVLREMEEHGWLSRETDRDATWRMGDSAAKFLNVSQETIKNSQTQ